MTTTEMDDQQDRVMKLATEINRVIAGFPTAEAHTALTLAVVCGIIATSDEHEWLRALQVFTEQAANLLKSKEHTDYIRACVQPVNPGHA